MLLNMISAHNEITDMLNTLQESKIKFYLTGSRFFGNHRETSDWDFFCGFSLEITEFLSNNGFKEIPLLNGQTKYGSFYADKNLARVYRHKKLPIDIQCQFQLSSKMEAQTIIKRLYPFLREYLQSSNKSGIRNVWDAVYNGIDDCVNL